MVTLTGPGGVGKTRLSLAVAPAPCRTGSPTASCTSSWRRCRDPAGGRCRLSLDAVGVRGRTGAGLGRRPGRVVRRPCSCCSILDNAEQVAAAAPRIADLVDRHARVWRVLVTSRAPLRLRAEHEFAVEPLALPEPGAGEAPAVRLLLERAADVSSGWGSAPGDAEPVAAVCARLAGLPPRSRAGGARCRLLDRRRCTPARHALRGSRAGPPGRQRTMRATLDWSPAGGEKGAGAVAARRLRRRLPLRRPRGRH